MSRYVYKELSLVDVLVLAVFVISPILYLAGDVLLHFAGLLFVIFWTATWSVLALIWAGVALWWVGRKLLGR